MLLHAVAHRRDDTLFNQFCYDIDAPLDAEAFEAAWRSAVARHPALRTAFLWEDLPRPLQVVRQSAAPGFVTHDWRADTAEGRASRYDALIAQDREAGFDPRRAPLMRFNLIRMTDDAWRFVWTSHHLVIDRWCIATLLDDVAAVYHGERAATNDQPAPPFRAYIDWLQAQDRATAMAWWRDALAGFEPPRAALVDITASETETLSPARYDALTAAARRHGLTPGIVLQGAWSLALNRLTGSQDVAFGATVAGRPADIPDVEHIVGSFINNVPVRRTMPADTGVIDWLRDAQREQFERAPFEYLAPAQIQRCAGHIGDAPLFDTLFVWLADASGDNRLSMRPVSGDFATAYPVTLAVAPDRGGLTLRIERRPGRTALPDGPLLPALTEALDGLISCDIDARLTDLPGFVTGGQFPGRRTPHRGADAQRSPADDPDRERAGEAQRGRERLSEALIGELLTAEWRSILDVDAIGPDDDFFQLGGTSLQAAALHTRVEAATRQSVPLFALFQAPTIAGMTHTLVGRDWPLRTGLVTPLRSAGNRAPLFCIASPEVNSLGYAMLTRHLPRDLDVYVVQAPPVSDRPDELDPSTLPALAAMYLDAVRGVQPKGPYRFLAMCAGSHITTEMVRVLEAEGENTEFFGVVNTYSLYTVTNLYYLNRFRNVLRWYASRVRGLLSERSGRDASTGDAPADTGSGAAPAVSLPPQENDAVGLRNPWIRDVGFERRNPGRPKLDTPITVFRIRWQPFWRRRDRALGWGVQSTSAKAVMLSTNNHLDIMREPAVRDFAAALIAELNAARSPAHRDEPAERNEAMEITA